MQFHKATFTVLALLDTRKEVQSPLDGASLRPVFACGAQEFEQLAVFLQCESDLVHIAAAEGRQGRLDFPFAFPSMCPRVLKVQFDSSQFLGILTPDREFGRVHLGR